MKAKLKLEAIGISSYYIQLFDFYGTDLNVNTGLFKNSVKPVRVLAVVDVEGQDEIDTHEMDTIASFFSDYLNSGNDGGLLWVPQKAAEAFPDFASRFLMEAYTKDELNLTNGPVTEAFVVYQAEDGLVVAMLDPECGTGVWDDFIKKFAADQGLEIGTAFDPEKLFSFEDCHLDSNLKLGRNDESVDVFLTALHERGVLAQLENDED